MTDDELLAELESPEGVPLSMLAANAKRAPVRDSAARVSVCLKCPFVDGVTCTKVLGNVFVIARIEDMTCPEGRWV